MLNPPNPPPHPRAPILWPAALSLPLHHPVPCQQPLHTTRARGGCHGANPPCPMNHPPAGSMSWACQAPTTGHSPFAHHAIQVFVLVYHEVDIPLNGPVLTNSKHESLSPDLVKQEKQPWPNCPRCFLRIESCS